MHRQPPAVSVRRTQTRAKAHARSNWYAQTPGGAHGDACELSFEKARQLNLQAG